MRWTSELVVGLFVLVALALFGYFTVRIGDFAWTREIVRWEVRFSDVSGLREGDPVLALGAQIGKVDRFELQPDHVIAYLDIRHPVALYEDYAISIRAPSILASHHIFVVPGTPGTTQLLAFDRLDGKPAGGLFGDALDRVIEELKAEEGTLGKLLIGSKGYDDLVATLESFRKLSADLEKADGALGQLLLGKQPHADLADTLKHVNALTKDLSEKDGALGSMLLAEDSRKHLDQTLANADEVSTRLKADGHLGKMLLGDKPQADLAATVESAKAAAADLKAVAADFKAADGALGRLLVGKESAATLNATLKDAAEVARKINKGDGTLAKLLNDAKAYEDLQKTLETFRKLSDDLAAGKGTVGKLLTDSGLHDAALKLVNQIREAVEDAREQAPVSTFTSTLLGGFR